MKRRTMTLTERAAQAAHTVGRIKARVRELIEAGKPADLAVWQAGHELMPCATAPWFTEARTLLNREVKAGRLPNPWTSCAAGRV